MHAKSKAQPLAAEEKTDTDRMRERRSKKKQQRLEVRRKEQLEKAKEKINVREFLNFLKQASKGKRKKGKRLPKG